MSDTVSPEPDQTEPEQPAAPSAAQDGPAVAPEVAAAKRARRGSVIAGVLSLPLISLGLIALAVPLAVWYVGTVFRTLVVVFINAVRGLAAAKEANASLSTVDAGSVSGVTIAVAIVGAVLFVAGALLSIFVLRSHGVGRPALVTLLAIPMGLVIAMVLSATIAALAGLVFGTSDSVGEVLGKAALGIALTVIGSALTTVASGGLVWPWVARLVRVDDPGKVIEERRPSGDASRDHR